MPQADGRAAPAGYAWMADGQALAAALLEDMLHDLSGLPSDGARPLPAATAPAAAPVAEEPAAFGYPLYREADGRLWPLLAVPAGHPGIGDTGRPRLNLGLLRRLQMPPARIARLRAELPASWQALPEALPGLLAQLGLPARLPEDAPAGAPAWLDRAVVLPAGGEERRAAWQELAGPAAASPPSAALAGDAQAAGPLADGLLWDVAGAGAEARRLAVAATGPLAVLEAPPGVDVHGPLAVLAAGVMLQGGSVLYLHPDPEQAAAFARRLEGPLGRDVRFAVPLLPPRRMVQEATALARALFTVAEQEAKAAAAAEDRRGQPTERDLRDLDRSEPDPAAEAERLLAAQRQAAQAEATLRRIEAGLPAAWRSLKARRQAPPLPMEACRRLAADPAERAKRAAELVAACVRLDAASGGKAAPPADPAEALRLLAGFAAWHEAAAARTAALSRLVRQPEARILATRLSNHEQARLALARPLYRAALARRLTGRPAEAGRQLRTLANQPGRWSAEDVRAAAATYPLWVGTPAALPARVEAAPGLFDLVLVDGAARLELPLLLPALRRGRTAVIAGNRQRSARRLEAAAAPGDGGDAGQPALAAAVAWREASGGTVLRPRRVARSHPLLARYLSDAFYGGGLAVEGDVRRLLERCPPALLGVRWLDVRGSVAAGPGGPANLAEANAVLRLLQEWDRAGHFGTGTRLAVAIAAALPGQPALLRNRLQRADLPQSTLDRLTVALPDELAGRSFDVVLLLPGLADGLPEAVTRALAQSFALFHDAVGAARGGILAVGDRQAALAAGGHAAALARLAAAEAVAGPVEAALAALLERAGVCWQPVAEPAGLRAIGAFGGLYDIRVAAEGEAAEGDAVALRPSAEEVRERADFLAERLARLA